MVPTSALVRTFWVYYNMVGTQVKEIILQYTQPDKLRAGLATFITCFVELIRVQENNINPSKGSYHQYLISFY